MESQPWHDKLVDFLSQQNAHEDELKAFSLLRNNKFLSELAFHLVSGLVTQDNKDQWTCDNVDQYLMCVMHRNNLRGSRMATVRSWTSIATHFPEIPSDLKVGSLAFCDVDFVPDMAELVKAMPREILRSLDYRPDNPSLDKKFISLTISNSIHQWFDDQEDVTLVELIVHHGKNLLTCHKLISALEQGAYGLEFPGQVLGILFQRMFGLGVYTKDLNGMNCLLSYGIDFRDLCSSSLSPKEGKRGYKWSQFETENQAEARRRINMSRDAVEGILTIKPITRLVMDYLFTLSFALALNGGDVAQ